MRILILGGSGFLGSHIADRFLQAGHEVAVFDFHIEQFRRAPAGLQFTAGDFGNVGALDELIASGFDAVIHCVSTTTPKSSNDSPVFDVQSNVIGTLNLLDICVSRKVGKLVFMSSGGTIYGDIGAAQAVDETYPAHPICAYGVSKLSIEYFLELYRHLHGLQYVALRVSNPYGERQSPLRALGALTVFLHRTLRRQPIEVWGDGSVTRDFIYVGDVADAVLRATTAAPSGIYNVGSGIGYSLRDILGQIGAVTGKEPIVTWHAPRAFDVQRIVLDASRFQAATGWRCVTPLASGIAITAQWLRDAAI